MTEIPTFPPVKKSPPPLTIVIVASLIGGMVGTFGLFTLFPEYRVAEIPPGINSVVVDRPGKVVVEEESRVDDLRNQVSASVGEIYSAKSIGSNPGSNTWFKGQIQAYATILTSDGYFVSARGAVAKGDYIRVKDTYFEVEEVVIDPASGLVFGRGDVSGLFTPALVSHKDLRPGTTAIGIMSDRGVYRASLTNLVENINVSRSHYLSSDYYDLNYAITVGTGLLGLPYFDMSGNLLGISSDIDNPTIIPAYAIQSGLMSYIQNGEVVRNQANLQYTYIPGQNGVKIYRRLSEGSAQDLLLDDVILKINGQDVNSDAHSFIQIFQSLSTGSDATLTVLRGEETIEISLPVTPLSTT